MRARPPLQRIPSGSAAHVFRAGGFSGWNGVVVWLVYRLFLYLLRSNLIATLVSIVAGVFTYATLLLMLKGLTEQEILRFPKGRTACKTRAEDASFALIE